MISSSLPPPSPPLGRSGFIAFLLLVDTVARLFILFGLITDAPLSTALRGCLALVYTVANVVILWSMGRWLKRRWADAPVTLEHLAPCICLAVLIPSTSMTNSLVAQVGFGGVQLLFGCLPLLAGLGLLSRRASSPPGRARRVVIMLLALAAAFAGMQIIMIGREEMPLSSAGRDAAFVGCMGLLVFSMWAWGDTLRSGWAEASASRAEILGCLLAAVAAIGLLMLSAEGAGVVLGSAALYLAVGGLPFVYGLGLFAKAQPPAPGRLRRLVTFVLLLVAALLALAIIGILWREMPFSGTAWNIFALGCAATLALPMWAAGRRFRRRWAGAATMRWEAVIGIGTVIAAVLILGGSFRNSQDATLLGLHLALNSLPFALGLGVFNRRPA